MTQEEQTQLGDAEQTAKEAIRQRNDMAKQLDSLFEECQELQAQLDIALVNQRDLMRRLEREELKAEWATRAKDDVVRVAVALGGTRHIAFEDHPPVNPAGF